MAKITLKEDRHSELGPSSSKRWMNCAGAPNLIKTLPPEVRNKSNTEANRGTAAHSVGAKCLMLGTDAWEYAGDKITVHGETFEVDADMVESAQTYVSFVRETVEANPGAILYVEVSLSSVLDEEAFGTGDCIIVVPRTKLIVADFKNGFMLVEPTDSQLKLYGAYALEEFGNELAGGQPMKDYPVELYIAQPRGFHEDGAIRKFDTTTEELNTFLIEEAIPAMQRTRDPNAPLEIGPWCKSSFCPAAGVCPAQRAVVASLPIAGDLSKMSGDELGTMLKRFESVEAFWDAAKVEAFERAKRGEKVKYKKLVVSKTNRTWRDQAREVQVIEGKEVEVVTEVVELIEMTYGDKAFTKKLVSPAQAEKTLPGGKDFVSRYAFKPTGGLTLVDESDSRPATKPLSAFDAAEGSVAHLDSADVPI